MKLGTISFLLSVPQLLCKPSRRFSILSIVDSTRHTWRAAHLRDRDLITDYKVSALYVIGFAANRLSLVWHCSAFYSMAAHESFDCSL